MSKKLSRDGEIWKGILAKWKAKREASKSGDRNFMIVGYWQDQQQTYIGDFRAEDPIGALRACKLDICGGSSGEFPELIAIFELASPLPDQAVIFPQDLDSGDLVKLDLWDEFEQESERETAEIIDRRNASERESKAESDSGGEGEA